MAKKNVPIELCFLCGKQPCECTTEAKPRATEIIDVELPDDLEADDTPGLDEDGKWVFDIDLDDDERRCAQCGESFNLEDGGIDYDAEMGGPLCPRDHG